MDEFDNMAQMYIQQMTERHAHNLLEFQRQLQRVRAAPLPPTLPPSTLGPYFETCDSRGQSSY